MPDDSRAPGARGHLVAWAALSPLAACGSGTRAPASNDSTSATSATSAVRNGGRDSPFLVLFERDGAGTSHVVPRGVAERIVAHDVGLAAIERTDPQAGCSGTS